LIRPSKKELLVKSAVYRMFAIAYESALAAVFALIGINVFEFIALNNIIKLVGYFIVELWWFRHIRTRLLLLEKLILNRLRK